MLPGHLENQKGLKWPNSKVPPRDSDPLEKAPHPQTSPYPGDQAQFLLLPKEQASVLRDPTESFKPTNRTLMWEPQVTPPS